MTGRGNRGEEDTQLTGDFDLLGADLHVDLSQARETPNPLRLASHDELHTYWRRLRSIAEAALRSETPRGRR
jgi:hypothetical protein